MTPSSRGNAVTHSPEFNIAVFAVLLNWPWEFLQVPFFSEMPSAQHWDGVRACTRATFGDAVIMLIAYWGVALRAGRFWLLHPSARHVAAFMAIGLLITIGIEMAAVAGLWMDGWTYSAHMPRLPVLGVGLTPVLQWIVIPPLVIWFCRRQMRSGVQCNSR